MKPVSQELLNLLATRQFFAADLFTFTLASGLVLRYCSGDGDITANGLLYPAGGITGPYFDRTDNKAKCHWKVGVEVDSLIFDVLPGSATISGTPFLTAIRQGAFDGAEVMLERAYMPTYGDTSRGTMIYFLGRVSEINCGRSLATFTVSSHLELLNIQMPRNLYQPGCLNNLGDASCTVNLANASFHTSGTVAAGSSNFSINANLVGSFQPGAFDLGTILFSNGVLSGQKYTVKKVAYGSPAIISLLGYSIAAPGTGDAFTLTMGCDKTQGLPFSTKCQLNNGDTLAGGLLSTAGVLEGMNISGTGIQAGTTVIQVEGVSVVMSLPATATIAGATITFQGKNGCSKFANQANYRGMPFIPQPSMGA